MSKELDTKPDNKKNLTGTEIIDVRQNIYYLYKSLSNGAFGYLYTILNNKKKKIKNTVVKIGLVNDLFSERGFYLKNNSEKCPHILTMIAHGSSLMIDNERYIFMIFPRLYFTYDSMLNTFENKKDKKIFIYDSLMSLFNVLEFLHKKNIIHSDIKDDNIMFDKKKNLFLIDFNTYQKKTLIMNKNNFTGSLKFASINAHNGIYNEKNDLESLLFNIISWLYGSDFLPWGNYKKSTIKIKNEVMILKKNFIKNFNEFIKNKSLIQYNNKIQNLDYNNLPSYQIFKNLFILDN